MNSIAHDTLTFTKRFEAPIAAVWDAYADSSNRVQWSVPADDAMIYDESNFREGGCDKYRCGPPDSLDFQAIAEYVRIEPESLIVYSETVKVPDQILATGLLTWEFEQNGSATFIKLTVQVTSFVGQAMIEGNRNGHTLALSQLEAFLTV